MLDMSHATSVEIALLIFAEGDKKFEFFFVKTLFFIGKMASGVTTLPFFSKKMVRRVGSSRYLHWCLFLHLRKKKDHICNFCAKFENLSQIPLQYSVENWSTSVKEESIMFYYCTATGSTGNFVKPITSRCEDPGKDREKLLITLS